MTERSAPEAGAIACPFVAFVDDRDERADVPDPRHRCYAEIRPAPRAIAHQQAFCLSAGFAACPTFQDWARREAARSRSAGAGQHVTARSAAAPIDEPADQGNAESVLASAPEIGAASGEIDPYDADRRPEHDERLLPTGEDGDDAADGDQLDEDPFDDRASRNPHRDWAAPPPWVDPGNAPDGSDPDAPGFLAARRGGSSQPDDLAPSPAGLSSSRWLQDIPSPRTPEGTIPAEPFDDDELERALAEDRANRERATAGAGIGATASSSRAARRAAAQVSPPKVSGARRGPIIGGPSWERPRRFEAYPTLKTRIGLPAIPRAAVYALALVLAAIVLFLLPSILHLGGGGSPAAVTPSPSVQASVATAPTEQPVATAQTYVVKPGDTLLKIAKKFGLTVDDLLAANKQVKNPNKIAVGDELTIPVAPPSGGLDGSSPAPESAAP
jgi:nucleoid-associated protein YgaU